jgi:hypothetical protein
VNKGGGKKKREGVIKYKKKIIKNESAIKDERIRSHDDDDDELRWNVRNWGNAATNTGRQLRPALQGHPRPWALRAAPTSDAAGLDGSSLVLRDSEE